MRKKWAVVVGGGGVGIIALIFLIGALLPQAHVASSSIILSQPPDEVWAVVRDLGRYAEWWDDITGVERLADRDGREVWAQRDRRNQTLPIELVEAEPPRRMVTRIADENRPFGGTWTYLVEPTPEGAIVTITEEGEVYNVLFRFMSRFVFGHHSTQESYLEALAQRFGEEAPVNRLE